MKQQYRLRRNRDFQRVRRIGKSRASPLLVLAFLQNEIGHSRFGFVVNKRLGNAVQRNKIKRRMREAVRLRIETIKPGFDLVVIARKPARNACYSEISETLDYLLDAANLSLPN